MYILGLCVVSGFELVAVVNVGGMKGNITFRGSEGEDVEILVDLQGDGRWGNSPVTIAIHEWPVDYTQKDKCSNYLGNV